MDIGVIGGADGPTTIFVTSATSWYVIAAIAIVFAVFGTIIWSVKKKKSKH